jgi:hypothetical protein
VTVFRGLTTYPNREQFASHLQFLLDRWRVGGDDLDFRYRLSALAFCLVESDPPMDDLASEILERTKAKEGE